MSAPHDRPAKEPGGMECMECGVIFVGEASHDLCAVCDRESRIHPAHIPLSVWRSAKRAAADIAFMQGEPPHVAAERISEAILAERNRNGWQDIASAPRDGTRFLAAEPDGQGWVVGIALWCKTPHVPLYGFHFTEGDPESWDIASPTHWQPLPSSPDHKNTELRNEA